MINKRILRILTRGESGCDISFAEVKDIFEMVKKQYSFADQSFWMWQMFQYGVIFGKRAERFKRAKNLKTMK